MRKHFTNTIAVPESVLQAAGRTAALDALAARFHAERELALPKPIRWRSAQQIHDSVISAERLARTFARRLP